MLVAQKTSVLLNVEEIAAEENRKEVCKWNHVNPRRRSNRDCHECHLQRNRAKGYERTPQGRYNMMRRKLRFNIRQKQIRIAELEEELHRYDKKIS